MSERLPKIAIFNLEPTLVGAVYRYALLDINHLEIGPEVELTGLPPIPSAQRIAFMDWIDRGGGLHLDALLDHTVQKTPERVAMWGQIMIQEQFGIDRKLAVVSNVTVHDLVAAYAEGMSLAVPGAKVRPYGRRFIKKDGVTTSRTKVLDKYSLIAGFIDTYNIQFIAESFQDSLRLLERAPHPLLVNYGKPQVPLDIDRVYWRQTEPHLVKFIEAVEASSEPLDIPENHEHIKVFDLRNAPERDQFVTLVTRNDPAFQ